jgi:hypothetical protein
MGWAIFLLSFHPPCFLEHFLLGSGCQRFKTLRSYQVVEFYQVNHWKNLPRVERRPKLEVKLLVLGGKSTDYSVARYKKLHEAERSSISTNIDSLTALDWGLS